MHTHLEQWAADTAVFGEQLGVRCLAQGSHLSRGQFLPEPRFEPTTSGYKSNALSIRATTAPLIVQDHSIYKNTMVLPSDNITLPYLFVFLNEINLNFIKNIHFEKYEYIYFK